MSNVPDAPWQSAVQLSELPWGAPAPAAAFERADPPASHTPDTVQ